MEGKKGEESEGEKGKKEERKYKTLCPVLEITMNKQICQQL